MTARANREEINLIAPKLAKTLNEASCLKVRLNIPNGFQRGSHPFYVATPGRHSSGRASVQTHLKSIFAIIPLSSWLSR